MPDPRPVPTFDLHVTTGLIDQAMRIPAKEYNEVVKVIHLMGQEPIFLTADYDDGSENNILLVWGTCQITSRPSAPNSPRKLPLFHAITVEKMRRLVLSGMMESSKKKGPNR